MQSSAQTLGVKMCGNCNPSIESMEVARKIARGLGADLVPYDAGMLKLIISACPAACVERAYSGPVIIRGLELNGRPCEDEAELVEKTILLLQSLGG